MAWALFSFIKGYLVLLAALSVFYFIGHFFLKPVRPFLIIKGFYAGLFLKILSGLLLVVFVYSSLFTCLKTISLGYILILGFIFCELYLLRRRNAALLIPSQSGDGNFKKAILGMLFISFFVYSWFARIILSTDSVLGYSLLDRDKVYYADISMMMGLTGEENRFGINNLLLGSGGMQPYHYLDLWLCDLGVVVGRNVHIVSFYLFAYPLLTILSAFGITALIERFTKINFAKQFFSVALLFTGAVYFNYQNPQFINAVNVGESPMEFYGEKYTAFYPFVILCFLFFSSEILPAFVTLLFLPVVSISLLPAVILGTSVFSITFFLRKKITIKELLRLGGYTLILLLFLIVVYSGSQKINPYLQNDIGYYTDLKGYGLQSIKVLLVELLYRVWQNPLRLIVLHLPYLVLFSLLLFKKVRDYKIKELFWLSFSIIASGLLLFGFFYKLFDAVQFYTNVLIILNVFCIYLLVVWCFGETSYSKKLKIGMGCVVFGLLAFKIYSAVWIIDRHSEENKIYSDEYLAKIKNIPVPEGKGMMATIFGGVAEEDKFYSFDKSSVNLFYQPFFKQFYPPVDLNVFGIRDYSTLPEVASIQRSCVESSPFFLFVKEQKQKNLFTSISQSRLDFIEKNSINYIVVSRCAQIDSLLEKRIVSEFKDERSGERFLCLKKIKE